MDTDGGEFLLASPSYRIEKARLRYENLLLSLDDDSVDEAERNMAMESSSIEEGPLYYRPDEKYDAFQTSEVESKPTYTDVKPHSLHLKSPITGIYKSITRRYVMDDNEIINPMASAMKKSSSRRRAPRHDYDTDHVSKGASAQNIQVSSAVLHENDDIIIAQQSEIEMLKYEMSELKMKSANEIQGLQKANNQIQASLDCERSAHEAELSACKEELLGLKVLLKTTRLELDADKSQLKQSLKHLERISRRSKSLQSTERGSFSIHGHHHGSHKS